MRRRTGPNARCCRATARPIRPSSTARRLRLPGGAGVAVWSIVNLEVWDIGKPMARQVLPAPTGVPLLPDVPNWSWHEYGMRVGFWRFHKLYERLGMRPTLSINARVCDDYERVAAAARDAGWEFMGHAWEQGPIHKEPDQRAMIHRSSMDRLEAFTGKRPVGWLGPGPDADLRDTGTAGRGRRAIYRRLGVGRRAVPHRNRARAAGDDALHGGAERHRHDDRAAPRITPTGCNAARTPSTA